jgi:hypothetical protein
MWMVHQGRAEIFALPFADTPSPVPSTRSNIEDEDDYEGL